MKIKLWDFTSYECVKTLYGKYIEAHLSWNSSKLFPFRLEFFYWLFVHVVEIKYFKRRGCKVILYLRIHLLLKKNSQKIIHCYNLWYDHQINFKDKVPKWANLLKNYCQNPQAYLFVPKNWFLFDNDAYVESFIWIWGGIQIMSWSMRRLWWIFWGLNVYSLV